MAKRLDGVGVRALRVRPRTRWSRCHGAVLAGLDREIALVQLLDHQHGDRPVRGTLRSLIARAKADNPIGWLFLIMGIAPLLTAATATRSMIYGAAT